MYVVGDIVTVDGWKFEIDRSKLQIKKGLGETKVKILQQVKEYIGKNENNKYQANILATIESDEDIVNITIQNPDGTTFEITPQESKKKIEKDMTIELDEEYKIIVKTNNKEETLIILERSIETIRTTEELVAFRDKVNTGLTYEGKIIELLNNIDLSSVCGENINGEEISWEPIGNYGTDTAHIFKGQFNGNGHTINNMYINTTSDYQGLFGYVQKGTIIGVIIGEIQDKESTEGNYKISIKGNSYVGAIVGSTDNSIIQNCGNNINITSSGNYIGGIVGVSSYTEIIGVYNNGDVVGSSHTVGGIAGGESGDKIKFSYNTGNIKGHYIVGGIGGSTYSSEMKHCYNIGTISNNGYYNNVVHVGGISGAFDGSTVEYCYNLGSITNPSSGSRVGGISGVCTSYSTRTSTNMTHCFNKGSVTSNGSVVGGLCGLLDKYCTIGDSYVLVGVANGLIGQSLGSAPTISASESLPTVYNVVNGLNDGDSLYWSKDIYSNQDLQTPKLKWESEVK